MKPSTAGPAIELVGRAHGGEAVPPAEVLKPTSWPSEAELGSLPATS